MALRRRHSRAMARDLARFRARARRRLRWVSFVCACVIGASILLVAMSDRIATYRRGETDLFGDPLYDPPFPVDAKTRARVDLERVHGELVPAWVMALDRDALHDNAVVQREDWWALREALAPDPNLVSLADELDARMGSDPFGDARRIDYLLWAWNDYLDRGGAGFRVEATLHLSRTGRPVFQTRSYRVVADVRNEDGYRVRLLRRIDATNVIETFLGHTPRAEDGALVAVDRVMHFATRSVWPLLHEGLDQRLDPVQRAFALSVRAEAEKTIPPWAFALLQETAVDQLSLIEVASSINGRNECGSTFRVWGLPYNGLPAQDRRALRDAYERGSDSDCPEVTLDEVVQLAGASERLGSTTGIESAVESLAAWVSRGVVAHELRHVEDGDGAPACPGCPQTMSDDTRIELAAYLASFADRDAAHVSLFQACGLPEAAEGQSSPHQRAMAFVSDQLLPGGCLGGPPADLVGRAGRLAQTLYGGPLHVALPKTLPDRVEILPRRRTPRITEWERPSTTTATTPR